MTPFACGAAIDIPLLKGLLFVKPIWTDDAPALTGTCFPNAILTLLL